MNEDKRGYTLIELLAVVAIIAIIVGVLYFGIISYINNANKIAVKLTEENIRDLSVLYVKENYDDLEGWHYEYNADGSPNEDSRYYCVSVQELINKGYVNEEFNHEAITTDSYIKVIRNENNKTYDSAFIEENSCMEYTISFVDKNNAPVVINDIIYQRVVSGGYRLTDTDIPYISASSSYYKFVEGPSVFIYKGWRDQFGKIVDKDYVVKEDVIVKIMYSLESGYGDAYLLKKGHQRPFNGESDESVRYDKQADIILTDNGGTTLSDFVLNCEDTRNCVLSLDLGEINKFLSQETKEKLEKLDNFENIDWYVLKYVSGTWHLDGQDRFAVNVGFVDLSKLDRGANANCRYLNNNSDCNGNSGYNLALTMYDKTLVPIKLLFKYSDKEFEYFDFVEINDNYKIISTDKGYYLKSTISKNQISKINSVVVTYKGSSNVVYESKYNYTYGNGTYIFELVE